MRPPKRQLETFRKERLEPEEGYRVLVVDDNPSIHDDFRRIFSPAQPSGDELDALAQAVFGVAPVPSRTPFQLDHATQGRDALDRVLAAREGGHPYALLFMDVRMPPGWDGVEATARVLRSDPDVHVVLCTAYPDRRWRQQVEELPGRDRVLVLKKPFDGLEVQQLACALCDKWLHARRDRARMRELERSVSAQEGELAAAAIDLRREIAGRALAENRLRKAERLEGLGRLAAGLCHEINNPLSFIVTSTELIQEEIDALGERVPSTSRAELTELLHAMSLGASRITRLVRNIRMFARHSEGSVEVIELEPAISTAVSMVQPMLMPREGIAIETRGVIPAMGRRFELEQVLINLLENALHAMAEQRDPPPAVTISARAAGPGSVAIDVVDNGPGIDEAILDKIFDPFFTTKPVNKGMGLGLSICHTFISDMNGSIDARNREEGGAVFTVTLPAAPQAHPAMDSSDPGSTAGPARCGRILVVDDEPLMLSALRRVLRTHAVSCCSSARAALDLCAQQSFDLILCDVMMPGLNGWDFHRLLAQQSPGMEARVAFITGGALLEEVRTLLGHVPNRVLEKPLDPLELRTFVAEQLEQASAASC